MKKIKVLVTALFFCLIFSSVVWADEPGEKPDYKTDYYMIVESKNGGIDIYSSASDTAPRINSEKIPNGTALYIEGEKEDKEKRTWGYVKYHGMYGYVPLDDCRPARRSEAIRSEVSVSEKKEVNYEVEVSSKNKYVYLHNGPGEKFDPVKNAQKILNGEKLIISQEVISEDTGKWGLTEYQGAEGWVSLDETKAWKDKELPADMVEMKKEETKDMTPNAQEKPMLTPEPSEKPEKNISPTPSKEPSPTSSDALNKSEEKKEEPTKKPEKKQSTEKKMEEAKEASGNQVSKSSPVIASPFVWIGVLSLLAVILLLVYHFKKR